MKTFLKKIFIGLALIFSVATVTNISTGPSVYAANPTPMTFGCRNFLGMTSWDCGVGPWEGDENLTNNIIIILANILGDMSVIAAYLVLGFVVYGGYLYIFSSGDPGRIQNAKKTLTRAFIGLTIVVLANVILNAIRFAFMNNGQTWADCSLVEATTECIEPTSVITNALQWFVGTSGVVALIFVVIGGIGYVTSTGDPGKLQKAKNTILYALIGMAIAVLAEIMVSFVSGIIHRADPSTSYINETIISKEYHETQNI